MRTYKIVILVLLILTGLFSELNAIDTFPGQILFRKKIVPADTARIYTHVRAAFAYGSLKPPSTGLMKAQIDTAEMLCDKSNMEIPALLHLARAEYFSGTNVYKEAIIEANIALKLSRTSGDDATLVKTYKFLGYYYLNTRMFNESIDNFNTSINLAKDARLKALIPGILFGLSRVYLETGPVEKFRNTLTAITNAADKERDTASLIRAYSELGTSWCDKPPVDHSLADSLLHISLRLAILRNDKYYIAFTLDNIGWNSYLQKKYSDAIKYYEQSLRVSIPDKNHGAAANAYGNLGTIYRDLGKLDLALRYYKLSIEQSSIINYIYNLSWVYEDMTKMYLMKGDTGRAYINYVQHKEFSDKILSSSSSQGLTQAKMQYAAETDKKEFELLSLRVRNQRLIIFGSIGLMVLSVAVLILLLSRAKIISKKKLSEMNRKIAEVTQANLRQQMNPHFIFNTLNSIQYYMYQHDKLATNNYLTKFSSLMRRVLENSQHTSVPLQDELDALSLYLELEKIRFKEKFDYVINIDEEIDPILYKIPTMLIQPYVENSICHGLIPAEEKGMIKIDLKLKKDYISCVIEDNGIGREAANNRNKNKSENNHHSRGTKIVKSRLDLVNSLYGTNLETIYTDLKNLNGEPEGTRVEIHIPLLT
jgi:tetratricopeptide (TPR) repeat protein